MSKIYLLKHSFFFHSAVETYIYILFLIAIVFKVVSRELHIPFSWSRRGSGFDHLADLCPFIEKLTINGCGLSNRNLQFLAKFEKLKSLSLAWTKIADSTLITIVKNNQDIEKINLLRCKRITHRAVFQTIQDARKLRYMNIVGTKVSSSNVFRILIHCKCNNLNLTLRTSFGLHISSH